MQRWGLVGWLGILALLGAVGEQSGRAEEAKRPNILLIMADDMGFSDLGCYGSEIATPHLDRLAAGGLRFTQFYNGARCCPTRAALLTGLYSHQAGIGHMVDNKGVPAYQGFLNDRCATIAEALRPAGYHALQSGKWHVGENRPHWPTDRGFERCFSLISGATNYFRLDPDRKMALNDQAYTPSGDHFYITDAFTEHAVRYVDEYGRKKEPFFLYLAYTAPHWPLHALPEDIAKYRGKYKDGWDALRKKRHQRMIELGIVDARWPLTPRDPDVPAWEEVKDKDSWNLKMAVYAAQIDRMDQGIGKILAKLKEVGALDNTLVLFLADNGGCAEQVNRGKPGVPPGDRDSFASYGPPWANASNTPFRLYKHWVHEGGIATPLIVSWPAVLKKGGGLTHQPGHLIDLMATCLDAAGANYPQTNQGRALLPLEGKSLVPILQGQTRVGHDALYWEHEGNRAVRQGKWKLVARHGGDWELYDLEADRTELNNLARTHLDQVNTLAALYTQWAQRSGVVPWAELQKRKAAPRKEVAAPGTTVRVAGIVLKWIRGDKEANYRRALPMIREAVANGAQMVCTTECFLDGYAIADKSIPLDTYRALGEPIPAGKYYQRLASLAAELKIHLVAGMLEADGEARYNTAVLIGPDGNLVGKYRKQKLGHETVRNTPGTQSSVFETPYGRLGVMICADRTEPGIVSRFCDNGADFLLCPSGGMFGPRSNDPIVQARSKENGISIVFVHPAEFLVTGPDGSIRERTLLGDQLLIAPEQVHGEKDENRILYMDLPVRWKSTAGQ